ncbi:multidrug ABC transporter [Sporanaerobium hydrogeniformans]|uniref:Multidrug ABC transporter n=1 Tax=Sporanaerobium hydrogeniformans TaxID=3072179 RepID=A0AC61DAV5_9FIRM|nr:multidrug ABC transporter [Sporanaerobium hydrogeniformans]
MNSYIILFLVSVFIASFSQILLKISANKQHKSPIFEIINPIVIFSYSLFLVSMLLTTLALSKVEYKMAAVIESIGYVYILILSCLILKEKIGKNRLIGNLMIIVGILIYSM